MPAVALVGEIRPNSEEMAWSQNCTNGWRVANCRGKPTAQFFPVRGDGAAARAICRQCPVQTECLEYAIADPLPVVGIFGGTDERERAAIRHQRRPPRTMTGDPFVTPFLTPSSGDMSRRM